jgi:dihydrolipoamide dehydrogenase
MHHARSTPRYDVAVIGAGTAGLAAWRAATAAGGRALLIEGGEGGTLCAREGCMPAKLLIAAADAAHRARDAGAFGVHAREIDVRFDEVMARVRSERDRFVGFVLSGVDAIPAAARLRGWARLLGRAADGAIRIAVEGGAAVEIVASAVVIATGSRSVSLPFERTLGSLAQHSGDVWRWDALPRRVVVFGPGAIGLELGQALCRLGAEVELLGLGGLVGPLSDPIVRDVATRALRAELDLDPDARDLDVWRDGDEVMVARTVDGRRVERRFDAALIAVGRRPALDGLGMEAIGVEPRAVRVDPATCQLADLPVFIAGDATGDRALLHEAADEGRIAGQNAASWPRVAPGERRSPLGLVFSDPQLAVVGSRFADLEPGSFVTGAVDLSDQGRSRVMRENRGWMHVYADVETGRLLGAELAHPRAEHLAHLLAWAHQLGLTVAQMLELPYYHPVIEEGHRTALRDAHDRLVRRAA